MTTVLARSRQPRPHPQPRPRRVRVGGCARAAFTLHAWPSPVSRDQPTKLRVTIRNAEPEARQTRAASRLLRLASSHLGPAHSRLHPVASLLTPVCNDGMAASHADWYTPAQLVPPAAGQNQCAAVSPIPSPSSHLSLSPSRPGRAPPSSCPPRHIHPSVPYAECASSGACR